MQTQTAVVDSVPFTITSSHVSHSISLVERAQPDLVSGQKSLKDVYDFFRFAFNGLHCEEKKCKSI